MPYQNSQELKNTHSELRKKFRLAADVSLPMLEPISDSEAELTGASEGAEAGVDSTDASPASSAQSSPSCAVSPIDPGFLSEEEQQTQSFPVSQSSYSLFTKPSRKRQRTEQASTELSQNNNVPVNPDLENEFSSRGGAFSPFRSS